MNLRRAVFLTVVSLLTGAASTAAQTSYIGASLTGDIVRMTHTESGSFTDNTGSGEAIGFALRVGTPIGANWGVELEFARPSVVKSQGEAVYPLFGAPVGEGQPQDVLDLVALAPVVYPPIFPVPLHYETRDRHTTVSTTLWALQNLSQRVALVYLGGIAFNRFEREYGYTFNFAPESTSFSRTIMYSARPVVGFESWIGLTEHVTLIPSLRLHGIEEGWLMRTGVGIAWSF